MNDLGGASCPAPISNYERVVLGHGSGGRLSRDLLERVILTELDASSVAHHEDQATLEFSASRLSITTDAFVVQPLFFPGGNIGDLAINGTVNDLAMGGAKPLYIALALILEEGFALADLRTILRSIAAAARRAGVCIVTGDTKVVERGKADGMYITTTGVGTVPATCQLSVTHATAGDRIVVSGSLGDHGIAVLSRRAGIELETDLVSDTAPLTELAHALLEAAPNTRTLRDPTRGGLSSALNEIAAAAGVGMVLEESALPIHDAVRGACELLGFDPLYVANEGKLVAIVPASESGAAVSALRAHPLGRQACVIGDVVESERYRVTLRSVAGGQRVVPMLAGEQLPRIC